LAHVRVHGGQRVVQQIHVGVADNGESEECKKEMRNAVEI